MAVSKIKSGDCVLLKHGGANVKMTVDHVFVYSGQDRALCKWYNSQAGKFDELDVMLDALKLCEDSK